MSSCIESYAMYHAAPREGIWIYLWAIVFSISVGFCMTHRRTRPSSSPPPNAPNR